MVLRSYHSAMDTGRPTLTSASTDAGSAPGRDRADPPQATACGLLMLRLGRAAGAQIGAALAALDMQPHEYGLLHALAEEDAASQSELAAALRVHPSNLVALVDGLEAEGLVERRRDPADRRRHVLALTSAGRARFARARGAVEEAEEDLLAPLEEGDRIQLQGYLERLAARACFARRGGGRRC